MKFRQLLFVALIALVGKASSNADHEEDSASSRVTTSASYRLPNNTVPLHYAITLVPDLEAVNFTFNGQAIIDVRILEEVYSIVFHKEQLDILDTVVTRATDGIELNSTGYYDEDSHFYTLDFAYPVSVGNYTINVIYSGQPEEGLEGFYRSYYTTSSGNVGLYASTFFAPVYARRAFPCFDEPALKATFQISIAHWPNQTVLSNTLNTLNSSTTASLPSIGGRVWTIFDTTPRMSTYLVAFTVFDFEHEANSNESFRIWFRPEARGSEEYSLTGETLLNELSSFTDINYFDSILSKMDQVAVPLNSPIAMENWGLITYREAWLLWQDGVSTTRDKQNIAVVGAHEFAHQWFGNLVTPEWWSYVWLSEGFSEYLGYYIADKVNPSWKIMEQFTVEACHSALLADSLNTTQPLNREVYSPDEIKSMFDVISYQKGACIIRMLSVLLEEPVFQEGLRTYLRDNSHDTGNPEKLLAALAAADENAIISLEARQVSITTMMDSWTNQKGYPVLTVARNYSTGHTVISQEPFLLKGRGSSNETDDHRWWIPFNVATQADLGFTDRPLNWIRGYDQAVFLPNVPANNWLLLNGQQAGFFRVNYDETNWRLVTGYLQSVNFTDIPPGARAQLIDDAFNLARAGYLHYDIALSLTRYLIQETDYVPWAAAFRSFYFLNTMLASSNGYQHLKTYLFSRVHPIHNSLGYEIQESDEHVTNFLRAESHSLACQMDCPGCNNQARQLVQNYFNSNGNDSIPVDLRKWAYCEGLREASIPVFHFMWERYLLTDVAGEQSLIINGMGCSLNENILNSYLNYSIVENSGMRSQHRLAAFISVYTSTPANVIVALRFLTSNYAAAANAYGGVSVVENLLINMAAHFVSEEHTDALGVFILGQSHAANGVNTTAARRALAIAEENIAWLEIYENDIISWLRRETSAANTFSTLTSLVLVSVLAIVNFVR